MEAGSIDFGPFQFDCAARVLVRGGVIVRLTPKAAEVLLHLLRNPGRVVDKAELIQAVWPNTFIEEGSLAQNIFQLRRVLGENWIETVPRRGYRFKPLSAPASTAIAVLPLLNLSGDPELEYFSDGLTDELISALASARDLRVAARSSAFQFKNKPADIREVGRVLNVASILEGTVRRSAGTLKVSVQLSSVADGFCLWSESYSRSGDDILALQGEIAHAILRSLKLGSPIASRRPANPRAYQLYLRGRHFWNQRPAAFDQAVRHFESAIREDPGYALAYVGLADCYATHAAWESGILPPRVGFSKAKELAEQAITIDESLAEAHTTRGYVALHYDWDAVAAEREFQLALELNPGYSITHHWYSHALTVLGRTSESLQFSYRALELDPLDLIINGHLAWHFYYANEIDAMESAVETLQQLHPGAAWTFFFLGWLRERQSRHSEAAEAFELAWKASLGSPVMGTALAHSLAVGGSQTRARELLEQIRRSAGEAYVSSYEIAVAKAALGETAEALKLLAQAIEERSAWLAYIEHEPRLGSLRGKPEYRRLISTR